MHVHSTVIFSIRYYLLVYIRDVSARVSHGIFIRSCKTTVSCTNGMGGKIFTHSDLGSHHFSVPYDAISIRTDHPRLYDLKGYDTKSGKN